MGWKLARRVFWHRKRGNCPPATSTLGIFHDKRYGKSSIVPYLLEQGPEVQESENEGREGSVDWVWKLLSRWPPGYVAVRSKCRAEERERGKARNVNQSIRL
jgi:hypothetical protein